jgi:hypothetical protein
MKFFKIIRLSLGLIALSSVYLSCTKNNPKLATTDSDFSNSTLVQVFDATVKSTRNYIYVNSVPVSGAALAYGGVFPATAYAFKVSGGLTSFLIKDTLSTTTQTPLSFAENMQVGRSYTIFTFDTITSVKQATVINNIVVPTDTTARLRFANFVYNFSSVPNVDVYSFRRGTTAPVFSNLPTTQVTEFIPYASGLTDTLYVYATGTTSPLIVKALVPILTPTRSYTAAYSGSYGGTKAISTFTTY